MLKSDLGAAAFGDVRQRARHARDLSVHAADRQAAAEHPAPRSVRMKHPVLGLQMRGLPGDVRVNRGSQARQVARVHEVKPDGGIFVARALSMPEDRVPARREIDSIPAQIPIPDAVARRAHGERVALLAANQIVERPLMADRIPDRALQSGRVELLLDEVVGHPERRRFEVDRVVALPAEDDHRRARAGREPLSHELEAGARAEAVIDQVDVVAPASDRRERLAVFSAPLDLEAGELVGGEHVASDQVVVRVVLDEKDAQRLSG